MKTRYRILLGTTGTLATATVALALVLGHTAPCPSMPVAPEGATVSAVQHHCYGAPEVLTLERVAKPVPADDELLIRVHSASVNPLDWHYLRGSPYLMRLMSGIGAPRETRLGVDMAGTVAAVGSAVTRFKPGDRVFGGWTGSFGEYLVIPESRNVTRIPDNVSFAQAAAVPIAGATALQALHEKGGLQPGDKVLVNGASGGVGTIAVQLAKAHGAEVHGVCSTRNIALVSSLGADKVYDYTRENYTESDERYDLVIDNVGNHSPAANRKMLKADGRLVLVGGSSGNWIGPLAGPVQMAMLSPFVEQELITLFAVLRGEDMATLASHLSQGTLKPVIDRHYPLRQIRDAIAYSETGRARGKIIVDIVEGAGADNGGGFEAMKP
jgi:NADPH:quinone reductase-like Zn-dependent oxidoreductase